MALACQHDSYLRQIKTKVKSCKSTQIPLVENGKKTKINGFEVILEDTVLFPEGGGQFDGEKVERVNSYEQLGSIIDAKRNNATRQSYLTACHVAAGSNGPWQKESGIRAAMRNKAACRKYACGQGKDANVINGIDVVQVNRKGSDALHMCTKPLEPGTEVTVEVNWTRRFDHMQQHSGQHLITAIVDNKYKFTTTSWNLGEKTSFIELDTPQMTDDQVNEVEKIVNEKILEGIPMVPRLYSSIKDPELQKVRTRGLPDDHEGPVRVVTIEGIEHNMCCGTHVSSLSHLQSIKLLGTEKGKKGKTNLVFVAGGRVLQYLGKCHENEKSLTSILKCSPDQHAELAEKLQKNVKVISKERLMLLRDLAVMEGKNYRTDPNRQPLFVLHRKEGDSEFMNIVVNEINDPSVLVFLTVGEDQGPGQFLLAGPPIILDKLATKVKDLLDGKGFSKNGRFQGKANNLSKRGEVERLLQQHLSDIKDGHADTH